MDTAKTSGFWWSRHACPRQENEKKQKREPKETAEELQECEMVFADF